MYLIGADALLAAERTHPDAAPALRALADRLRAEPARDAASLADMLGATADGATLTVRLPPGVEVTLQIDPAAEVALVTGVAGFEGE